MILVSYQYTIKLQTKTASLSASSHLFVDSLSPTQSGDLTKTQMPKAK
jgi:hypothetical protein